MRRTALAFTLTLLLAGCGISSTAVGGPGSDTGSGPTAEVPTTDGPTTGPPTTDPPGGIGYARGADDVIISIYEGPGGFGPYNPAAEGLPSFRLYGDGTLVTANYRPKDSPSGTETPKLTTTHLSADEVQDLLEDADDAGLVGNKDPNYGSPGVTDLGTTDAKVTTDAGSVEGSAYALGIEDDTDVPVDGMTPHQIELRRGLTRLIEDLDQQSAHGTTYEPQGYAVLAYRLGDGFHSDDVRVETWPLDDPGGGERANDSRNSCKLATPEDVRHLQDSVKDALEPDPPIAAWKAPSGTYQIGLRPLLPDEHDCSDVRS
jgi:hypothetical protein